MTKNEAYTKFYNYCKPIIYKEVSYLIKNTFDAEELTNDAFLRVCKKLHLYKRVENINFRSWIRRLSRNICLRFLERKRAMYYLDDYNHNIVDIDSMEDKIVTKELKTLIKSTLTNLNDKRQKIMSLRFISDLKLHEIAKVLDIPEGTVKCVIHRSLKQIISNNPKVCQQLKSYSQC